MTDTSAFLELYDDALPHVYGYLARRCANAATAEDLTAETFMAAVAALHNTAANGNRLDLNIAWLIGTARHKLIDHWRRTERRKEELAELWSDMAVPDPTDAAVDVMTANGVLAELAPSHRAVLTLRYLDDLPVSDVAATIGRTVHATEALLTRAKAAFRNHADHIHSGQETS
ncbi:MAG TPA: RNA polymerase sigma factor [Ilumatobacteraceae bacterium]|nr:RNA polymerase sigma factor [Ilumatobacteraceae bacterium]